ncbi:MAG TPA: DUF1439 domain-containing protein, partial [Chthoniobacter sp.]|nr:DUF1439 domain-containing protein [Chthoniobacter sp.]
MNPSSGSSVKRILFIALAAILLMGIGGFLFLKGRRFPVIITQTQIDDALEQRFPVSKSYLKLFDISYANPEVTLLDEAQRVRVGLDATLNLKVKSHARQFTGGATLTGRVDYHPDTQEFFLDDVKFERLSIEGIPPEYMEPVSTAASKAAQEYVRRAPIYRLKETDTKSALTKVLLKDV